MNATGLPFPPNTVVRSSVVLSLAAWLGLWTVAAAYGFGALEVTSGTRTPESQAAAMLAKDPGTLRGLYARDDIIDELLAAPRTVSSWAAIIGRHAAAGDYLSDHQKGDAIDVIPPADRSALIRAAARVMVEAIDEGNHIHLEGLPGPVALAVPAILGAGAILAVVRRG